MNKTYDDVPTVLLAEPIDTPYNARTTNLTLPDHQKAEIEERQISRLMEQGYTRGLAESLNKTKAAFGQRVSHHCKFVASLYAHIPFTHISFPIFLSKIWIIDNSGSMRHSDGHRIVPTLKKGDVKMVPCSRWEEIQECVNYHISLAGAIEASTYFRVS